MTEGVMEWQEWWDATERKVLLVQTCEDCDHRQHYPRALCLACGSDRLGWTEALGEATVYSFTESHLSPDPDRFQPPYVIAIVELAEGPRILTRIVNTDTDGLACDQPVQLTWAEMDGCHLPVFQSLDKEKPR